MSLSFRKVKRRVLNGPNKGEDMYYAMARSNGVTDLDSLCELISARSTVSSADVKGVLDSLNWVMNIQLKAGMVVQVGELGNFRLSIGSKGVEEEEKVSADLITGARIIFSPGSTLRDTRRKVTFTPMQVVEKIVIKEPETPEDPEAV